MNEAETRAEHIDKQLAAAGWGVVEGSRIRREYPTTTSWRLVQLGFRVFRGLLAVPPSGPPQKLFDFGRRR